MPNINKVVYGNNTLIDLTGTTATADTIMEGYGAYGKDGAWIDGTKTINLQEKTVSPTESTQVVTADTPTETIVSDTLSTWSMAAGSYSGSTQKINLTIKSGMTNWISTFPHTFRFYLHYGKWSLDNNFNVTNFGEKTIDTIVTLSTTNFRVTIPTDDAWIDEMWLAPPYSNQTGVSINIKYKSGLSSDYQIQIMDEGSEFGSSGWPLNNHNNAFRFYGLTGTIYDGLSQVTVSAIPSDYVGSAIDQRDGDDLTASGATVTVPAGYYSEQASKAVATGSATTPTTTITANPSINVSNSGLITASVSASQGIAPDVNAGYISTGTAGTVTASGSNTQQLSTQAATTITPTESSQTAVAAGKYTTGDVTVAAIPSNYVGSSILRGSYLTPSSIGTPTDDYYIINMVPIDPFYFTTAQQGFFPRNQFGDATTNQVLAGATFTSAEGINIEGTIDTKSSTDLTASGATVTVPSGYYAEAASKSVASGTAGTPTATKGTVSNHSVSVTPSVTNTTGYITGGTKTGTAVTVSASELVSGTLTIDSSGTKDVTNYASASVNAGTATNSGTASVGGATVTAGTNSITLSKSVPITPDVTAGYISSGTSGNVSVSLTGSVTTKGAATYTPTTTNQTIAGNTYLTGTQTIAGDADLVASNIKKDVNIFGVTGTYEPSLIAKTVTPTAETQVINANTAYIQFELANPTSVSNPTRYWDVYRRGGSTWYYYVDNDIVLGETYHIEVSFYRSGYNRTYTAELDTVISSFPFNISVKASSGQTATIILNTITQGYRFSNNLSADEDTPANDTLTVSIAQVADGLSQVTVNGDADLVAGNIKKDVNIFGITGTYESNNDFVITLSKNQSGEWEPDCTYAEAKAAYDANKNVVSVASDGYTATLIDKMVIDDEFNNIYYAVSENYDYNQGGLYAWGHNIKGYNWTSSGIEVDENSIEYNTSTATATTSDVVSGKRFFNADGIQVGTYAPNLITKTVTPQKTTQIVTPDVIDETTIISQALSSYGGSHQVTSGGSWYTDVTLASGQGSRFTSFPMSIHLYIYFRSQGVMSGGNSYMRGTDTKIDLTVTLPSENYSVEIPVSSTYIKKIVLEPYSSSNRKPRIYIYDPDSFSTSSFYVYIRNADASFPQYGWSSAPYDNAFRIYPVEQYDGLSQVTVNGDADLVASNIKSGVEIFGVTGTYQADTGAVADEITQLQGGGDWHNVYGVDLTQDTVTADKLLTGYTAHDSAGNAITGTYSGGGGGLEYEEGTWTPSTDTERELISFTNTHTGPPIFVMLTDATGTDDQTSNTNYSFSYTGYYNYSGEASPSTLTSNCRYGQVNYIYRGTGNPSGGTINVSSLTGGSAYDQDYYVSNTGFYPYTNSTSRYWRTTRTYKWIAVWGI